MSPGIARVLVACVLTAHVQVPAGQAPAKPAAAVIVGQLVDGSSGAPVSSAMITLWPPAAPLPLSGDGVPTPGLIRPVGAPQPLRVLTDANGRFVFHSLAAGSYSLSAGHPAYLPSVLGQTQPQSTGAGRRVQLADDDRVTNVVMKTWKFASIAGTVLDEAGEPVVGSSVRLLFAGSNASRPYEMRNTATTDDRGMYRFGSLPPGDYLVVVPAMVASVPMETAVAYFDGMAGGRGGAANPVLAGVAATGGLMSANGTRIGDVLVQSTGGRGLATQVVVDAAGKTWVYPTTYFPGASAIGSATVVTVRSGEERTAVNIPVKPVPALRVSGRVTGPDGPAANMTVKFVPAGMDGKAPTPSIGADVAQAITRTDGTFTAVGVPAGDYVASVLKLTTEASGSDVAGVPRPAPTAPTEPVLWGRASFTAGPADVERVTIRLATGITVSGRVEFEPGAIPAPGANVLQRAGIVVRPIDSADGARPQVAFIAPDGSFKTNGSAPGRYTLTASLNAPGWTLKSAVAGTRDLFAGPIELTEDITGLVVTYTDQACELSGSVVANPDDLDVYVVLVPVDPRAATQLNLKARRAAPVGPDGAYRLANVLPGDYFVVAAPFADGSPSVQSDQTLSALARRGTRLTLTGREKRSMQLTVVRGR